MLSLTASAAHGSGVLCVVQGAHRFTRAMIRSVASLNYTEVQEARDGRPNDRCVPGRFRG